MKKILFHIAVYSTIFHYSNCYAATDTLPPCINNITYATPRAVTEYEYKGQHWFSFTITSPASEKNYPDKLITTRYYNYDCHLMATWMKGGIAGFNKITPDTIEKEKIITLRTIIIDTTNLQKTMPYGHLSDTINKLAQATNASKIKEYNYKGIKLYLLLSPTSNIQIKSTTIDEPYYDETGKIILIHKRAVKPMYSRSEKWIPENIKTNEVIAIPKGEWNRKENHYIKISQFTPGYR